jgi:hypothetical protein
MTGASPFPRHWIYDDPGQLVAKSGLADFSEWMATSARPAQPMGSRRQSAADHGRGKRPGAAAVDHDHARAAPKPAVRKLAKGTLLAEQGDPGHDIYLLLDGVLTVSVDGAQVGELGPGAVMGERALLEGGRRTATLRAVTDCVIATAANDPDRPGKPVQPGRTSSSGRPDR